MSEPEDKLAQSYAYAGTFLSPERAAKYERKFDKRIDAIRHRIEVDILKRYAKGRLFDCSVGSGRFIPELDAVTSYEGMDYSKAFVELVSGKYPQATIKQGDLLKGIEAEGNAYDTVLCMRTLFQMTRLENILAEMVRLAKPGGFILFDYGKPREGNTPGINPEPGAYDVATLAAELPIELEAVHGLDSRMVMAVKRGRRLSNLFHHRANLLPDGLYLSCERILSRHLYERALYVFRKSEMVP